ncbi:kinesin light chain, putative [Medicago truncatula]|uniref:Kinesin light chain, putative n=1 Tax=Medicago truncatula TaxID=3880 RepID=A0A072V5D8_MEDTR|nr:kinesin light chain, putative [Medicago truncatula]
MVARTILEKEYGPYHPDTLGVYCNLVRTYDAMGRVDDAIEMLEYVVGMREENLGTANPDVDDEKCRLAELLKEAGRSRNRKSKRSLETLLDSNSQIIKDNCTSINVFNLYVVNPPPLNSEKTVLELNQRRNSPLKLWRVQMGN